MLMEVNVMNPLTKEGIEKIIKDRMSIEVELHPVPEKVFGNMADYYTEPLNNYPYLHNARYYARTMFGKVDVYLTFENEIHADNYDGGFYRCKGKHYIVLLKDEKPIE
jgi:hypothetical protein